MSETGSDIITPKRIVKDLFITPMGEITGEKTVDYAVGVHVRKNGTMFFSMLDNCGEEFETKDISIEKFFKAVLNE